MPLPMIAKPRRSAPTRKTTPAVRIAIALLIDRAVRHRGLVVPGDVLSDLLLLNPDADEYDLGTAVQCLIVAEVVVPEGFRPTASGGWQRQWRVDMRKARAHLRLLMDEVG